MKCPDCKKDGINRSQNDPILLSCTECHGVFSESWAVGFWMGYIEAKNAFTPHRQLFGSWLGYFKTEIKLLGERIG